MFIPFLRKPTLKRSFAGVSMGMVLCFGSVPVAVADDEAAKSIYAEQSFSAPILEKGRLTSNYGIRKDPFTEKASWHGGVDLTQGWKAPLSTPADGTVVFAKYRKGYGRTVDVQLTESGNLVRFAHMHSIKVAEGDAVVAGDVVGLMGKSGRDTGPHVHIEYHQNGKQYDPVKVPGLQLTASEWPR